MANQNGRLLQLLMLSTNIREKNLIYERSLYQMNFFLELYMHEPKQKKEVGETP